MEPLESAPKNGKLDGTTNEPPFEPASDGFGVSVGGDGPKNAALDKGECENSVTVPLPSPSGSNDGCGVMDAGCNDKPDRSRPPPSDGDDDKERKPGEERGTLVSLPLLTKVGGDSIMP